MSIIEQLATSLERDDDQPNFDLAQKIAHSNDVMAIQELVVNLENKDKKIQSDCIKVLYEVGKIQPKLIASEAETFMKLLKSPNNRLVWGSMQALSTMADIASDVLMPKLRVLQHVMEIGSVITVDKGVITLAKLASVNEENNAKIFPYLLNHLQNCRSKEVPQHAESTFIAVTKENKEEYIRVLEHRAQFLTPPQLKRVQKLLIEVEKKFM